MEDIRREVSLGIQATEHKDLSAIHCGAVTSSGFPRYSTGPDLNPMHIQDVQDMHIIQESLLRGSLDSIIQVISTSINDQKELTFYAIHRMLVPGTWRLPVSHHGLPFKGKSVYIQEL